LLQLRHAADHEIGARSPVLWGVDLRGVHDEGLGGQVRSEGIQMQKVPKGEEGKMSENIQAFPVVAEKPPYYIREGMTLRDWFAGMALTGVILNATEMDFEPGQAKMAAAKLSYMLADAMMEARGK
jgi:hypothetical protein